MNTPPTMLQSREKMLELLPRNSVGAEVGVCRGDFSARILAITPAIEHLHLIDAWQHLGGDYECDPENVDDGGHEERERAVRKRFENDLRVTIHKGLSQTVLGNFPRGSFDWIYLDADHSMGGVSTDLLACCRLGVPIIMGHDYRDDEVTREMHFGVVRAVDTFCHVTRYRLKYLTEEDWPSYWLEREP